MLLLELELERLELEELLPPLELELLLESAEKRDQVLASLKDADKKTIKEKKRPCPICGKHMKKVIADLDDTQVIDLEPIRNLINLKQLFLRNCKNITDEQVEDLQKALPNLEIKR